MKSGRGGGRPCEGEEEWRQILGMTYKLLLLTVQPETRMRRELIHLVCWKKEKIRELKRKMVSTIWCCALSVTDSNRKKKVILPCEFLSINKTTKKIRWRESSLTKTVLRKCDCSNLKLNRKRDPLVELCQYCVVSLYKPSRGDFNNASDFDPFNGKHWIALG